jgi:hypothetical protein
MKSWFTKYRICKSIDENKPFSVAMQQEIARNVELRCFEEELTALDRRLKEIPTKPSPEPGLHDSIMVAVRAAKRASSSSAPRLNLVRWLPAPALAALAIAGFWWMQHQAQLPPPHPLELSAALSTTFDLGDEMAHSMPSLIVAPLSDEIQHINEDVERTAEFLLASLP